MTGPYAAQMIEAPEDSLHWHALNYRTAGIQHAEGMWQELLAYIDRRDALVRSAALEEAARVCEAQISTAATVYDCAEEIRAIAASVSADKSRLSG